MAAKHNRLPLAAVIGVAVLLGAAPAEAAVESTYPMVSFATTARTITLGSGTVTFSAVPGALSGSAPAQVSTTGSDLVSTFFGSVTDFSAGSTIDQTFELYGFSAYPSPGVIPDSLTDDFIGLAFNSGAGVQYGYAEVNGLELVSYGFQTTPNTTILTAAVPEPAAAGLLASGLAALGFVRGRRGKAGSVSS